jgi:GMP synthase (glutamine-hydrolysing)
VEPLAELYKVEVRELGEELQIPHDLIWRHPFPGPGLGVRLLCSSGKENFEDRNVIGERVAAIGRRFGLEAVPLPLKSVGVKADLRSYEHPVMLTGAAAWDTLIEAAGTLLKEVEGINRCIWNLEAEAPGGFELRAAKLTKERLDLLREADRIVMDGLRRHGMYEEVWQCPTVLAPLVMDGQGEELCIVRPVRSQRAMTASAARLPDALLGELRDEILALPKINCLAMDLTSKPPGTIEWE